MKRTALAAVPWLALLYPSLAFGAVREATPATFQSVYDLSMPGDEIRLSPGDYGEALLSRPGVAIRGGWSARTFSRITLTKGSDGTIIEEIEVRGAGLVIVSADRVTVRRAKIIGNTGHGVWIACITRDEPCSDPADDVVLEGNTIENNAWKGIDIDAAKRLVFVSNRVRYNGESGWLDNQDCQNALVEHNEFAHNGQDPVRSAPWGGHGMYTKGVSHKVQHNKFYGNTGYGFHCWASCRGTAEAPYLFMWNEARDNAGSGIVIAGTPTEAQPGDDGLPKYVFDWHNDSYDNGDSELIP